MGTSPQETSKLMWAIPGQWDLKGIVGLIRDYPENVGLGLVLSTKWVPYP